MDAAGELHVKSLFDGFEKVHHEMMGDIKAAESQDVLVISPLAFYEPDIQPFLFEKALFDGGKDRCFASKADVADTDFSESAGSFCGLITSAEQENCGQSGNAR